MSQYCLSWDNHSTNVLLNLRKFYECQQLLDITLSCENQKIGVHKCILMAGSLYFKEHLQKYSDTRIIALKTIEYKTLKLLIEFMYRGEIFVNEEDLNSVLVAAKFFKIYGLNGIKLDDITNSDYPESYQIEDPEFIKLTKESGTNTIETLENLPVDLHTGLNSVEHEVVNNPVNDTVTIEPQTLEENTDNEKKIHVAAPQPNSEQIIPEEQSVNDTILDENASVPYETDTVVEEAPYEVFGTEEYIEEHLDSLDENDYTSDNEDPLSQDVSYAIDKDRSEFNKKEVLQMLEEAGIPTDVPIFCEDGDGKYVELTQDIVEEIASGGQVIYQVVDEDGNAGDLLLGTTVRKSRASSRQDCNTSDRIVADDLYTSNATPHDVADNMIHESEIEHNAHVQNVEVDSENVEIENKDKTSARAPRDRKMNSRYFNSNLTSPFLELRQKRGHKRKRSISENDIKVEKDVEIKKEIIVEQVSEFCDIEQKIAELHADNGYVDDHPDEHNTTIVLENVNGFQKSDNGNILKVLSGVENGESQTTSHKRQSHHPSRSKVDKDVQIVHSPQRKTSSDNSDTSSQSTSKEIPYALGLLPLQKALKKIQNMPDHTPRKTRSNIQNSGSSSKTEIKSSNDTTNGFGDREIKNGVSNTKKIESDKYDVLRKKRKGM